MRDRPVVVQTEAIEAEPASWRAERAELVRVEVGSPVLDEHLARADALLVKTYTTVDAELLDRAPNVRVVGRAGVGLDNVDLDECRARGIRVVYTPDANSQAVAELVVAFMCDALRPRVFLDSPIDTPTWLSTRRELIADRQMGDLTMGIIGLGRVGSRVARASAGLGMRVVHHDLLTIASEHSTQLPRDELLATADVVSVHIDGRSGNRRVLDDDTFGRLKSDAVFINTSRGFVVDHDALARFLGTHPAACAMLDVHDPEPITAANPLLAMPNAHLSPHIASATRSAKVAMSWVVRDIHRVLEGEEPEHAAV